MWLHTYVMTPNEYICDKIKSTIQSESLYAKPPNNEFSFLCFHQKYKTGIIIK